MNFPYPSFSLFCFQFGLFTQKEKNMNRGLKLYDKFLASSRIYTSVEAVEMTCKCLEFMNRNRRKFRFTEKMIRQEEKRLKRFISQVKKKPKRHVRN